MRVLRLFDVGGGSFPCLSIPAQVRRFGPSSLEEVPAPAVKVPTRSPLH